MPPEIDPRDDQLPSTHWSMLQRAGDPQATTHTVALAELLSRYRPALLAYLLRAKRMDHDRAEDLVHEFIMEKFLDEQNKNLAARADPARGRFRVLLLRSLDNFVNSRRRRERAAKRCPPGQVAPPEVLVGQPGREAAASHVFDVAWAHQVLALTIQRMEQECRANGQFRIWEVLDARVLGPTLRSAAPIPYEQLVQRLGFHSPIQASNALMTAKRIFTRTFHRVVAEYSGSPAEAKEEIGDLRAILSRAGAEGL